MRLTLCDLSACVACLGRHSENGAAASLPPHRITAPLPCHTNFTCACCVQRSSPDDSDDASKKKSRVRPCTPLTPLSLSFAQMSSCTNMLFDRHPSCTPTLHLARSYQRARCQMTHMSLNCPLLCPSLSHVSLNCPLLCPSLSVDLSTALRCKTICRLPSALPLPLCSDLSHEARICSAQRTCECSVAAPH